MNPDKVDIDYSIFLEAPSDLLYSVLIKLMGLQVTGIVSDCILDYDANKTHQALEILQTYGECIEIANSIKTDETENFLKNMQEVMNMQRKLKIALDNSRNVEKK